MPSWNKRFFIPSLLLTCMLLSGAVLAQPQGQMATEPAEMTYLPLTENRVQTSVVTQEVQLKTEPMLDEQGPLTTAQVKMATVPNEGRSPQVNVSTPEASSSEPEVVHPTPEEPKKVAEPQPTSISVKLTIQGPGISKSGKIPVEPGSTVLQVLKKGSNQLDFSLKTSQHSSLGVFVEGIAGVTNNPKTNSYWLYYVNGQFASRGVSLQTVQEGDIITWVYE